MSKGRGTFRGQNRGMNRGMGGGVPVAATCTTERDKNTSDTTVMFGGLGSAQWYEDQSMAIFTASASYTVCKITVRLNKTGSPNWNIQAAIYSSVEGTPTALVGTASANVATSTLTTSETAIEFTGVSAALTSGTVYHVMLLGSGYGDASNHVDWAISSWTDGVLHRWLSDAWFAYETSSSKYILYST